MYSMPLLPTSLVGSYPQPEWLIDREKLSHQMPPRVRAQELWRIPTPRLEQAQDDATLLAIRQQEAAGLDIITDGEIRRESYSNRFATALDGLDLDHPGTITTRSGHRVLVPRVVGKIRRRHPVEVRDLEFLRAHTDRLVKITVPGPFTMSQQAQNEHYPTEEEMALDYAAAVNLEIKDFFAAGADVVQIDEPYMEGYPEKARQYGLQALERALEGVTGTTSLHICFGYAALVPGRPPAYSFLSELAASSVQQISIETAQSNLDCSVLRCFTPQACHPERSEGPMHLGAGNAHVGTALGCPAERSSAALPKSIILGVLDLSTHQIETPDAVAARIRRALPFVPAERLIIAPDCGMKYLPAAVAFAKMKAMVEGARRVRAELLGSQHL